MFSEEFIPKSIIALESTVGAAEQTVNLTVDGSAPAASVAVPAGEELVIPDFLASSAADAIFRLQVNRNDGNGFTDLIPLQVALDTLTPVNLETPKVVKGGVGVAIRLRAQTPGAVGGAEVMATIGAYTQKPGVPGF